MSTTATLANADSLQKQITRRLKDAILPDRSIEAWRKIDLSGLNLESYHPDQSRSEFNITLEGGSAEVLTLDEALQIDGLREIILQRYTKILENPETNYFRLLSLAHSNHIQVIHVKRGEVATAKVVHRLLEGNALYHRLFIVIEAQGDLVLHEELEGFQSDESTLWIPQADIEVKENARLRYVQHHRFEDSEFFFPDVMAQLHAFARFELSVIHRGGVSGKGFYHTQLLEQGAEFHAIGVGAGKGREFHDIEFQAEHLSNNTNSSILYKCVLRGKAHHVFDGHLIIPHGLKNIEAIQVNRNILLEKTARAESMPRLQTLSDSVMCEHGTTVGELDDEALFFLMSRGISEEEARRILIKGFINDIVQRFPLKEEKIEAILGDLEAALAV